MTILCVRKNNVKFTLHGKTFRIYKIKFNNRAGYNKMKYHKKKMNNVSGASKISKLMIYYVLQVVHTKFVKDVFVQHTQNFLTLKRLNVYFINVQVK